MSLANLGTFCLQPENLVFESKEADSPLKLIDFGCAKQVSDDEMVCLALGCPASLSAPTQPGFVCSSQLLDSPHTVPYVAPEILRPEWKGKRAGHIWKSADVWCVCCDRISAS